MLLILRNLSDALESKVCKGTYVNECVFGGVFMCVCLKPSKHMQKIYSCHGVEEKIIVVIH